MPSLELKRFDTYPPVQATLTDSNGPINLASATTVKFIMKGTSVLVTGSCTIVNAATGQVQYAWGVSDTSVADIYQVEFEIHWNNGGIQTVPNTTAGNPTIQIDADLEDT
jgi:hypothetical protein